MSGQTKEVDLTGEVFEADVRNGRFQLLMDDQRTVSVHFSDGDEETVTTALKEHKTVRLRLKGIVELSTEGTLLKVVQVEDIKLLPAVERAFDPNARPIGEIIAEIAREVPDEVWDQLPTDLSENLDHYLYGAPKK